jgi:hypothetical protein
MGGGNDYSPYGARTNSKRRSLQNSLGNDNFCSGEAKGAMANCVNAIQSDTAAETSDNHNELEF